MNGAGLTAAERRRLAVLADALIPRGDGMPAASEVDVHGGGADRVAALFPGLIEPLRRALAADLPVGELRVADAAAFQALTTLVAGAYLTEPRIHVLLGYPGRPPLAPPDPDAAATELRELVRPVQERGYGSRTARARGSGA